jgi:hypothetical protein
MAGQAGGLIMDYSNRQIKSYSGQLMQKGKSGEEIVLDWLRKNSFTKEIIDMREFRISQRLDVDCGIETLEGALVLAEIKTDYNLGRTNNFLFEAFRINHFTDADKVFYLGWTFRSPAKYLLYYSPNENVIYRFSFKDIRETIARYIANNRPQINITPTDEQKTTFNILMPQAIFKGKVQRFKLNGISIQKGGDPIASSFAKIDGQAHR